MRIHKYTLQYDQKYLKISGVICLKTREIANENSFCLWFKKKSTH